MWNLYLMTTVMVVVGGAIVYWGRQSMMQTLVNRRIVAAGITMFALQLLLQLGAELLALPRPSMLALHLFVWGSSATAVALFIDRRFWAPSAIFLAAFPVACVRPALCWDIMSAANFALLVTFVIAWWKPGVDRPRFLFPDR
jgi:hypothetical protein